MQDLNDETGEIQSVELTNVVEGEHNEEENIIKLKIKRRRKINKGMPEQKPAKIPRNEGEYIKLEQQLDDSIPIIYEKPNEKF